MTCRASAIVTAFAIGVLGACGGGDSGGTTPTTPTNDAVTQAVGTSGGTVVTPSGAAGVQIPAGALTAQVMVTITRLSAPSSPGAGPLPTSLKQYGPYYELTTSPQVTLGDSARVGVCQVTDPANSLYPPEPHDLLRLAHTAGGSLEVLERVNVSDFLLCSNVTASGPNSNTDRVGWRGVLRGIGGKVIALVTPARLYAAHGGLGGKVKSFSPFGAVQLAQQLLGLTSVSAGDRSTCAREASGKVYCWGANTQGELGNGSTTPPFTFRPGLVSTQLIFSRVTAGAGQACALTNADIGYCWGRNDDGRVGDGTTTNATTPVHAFNARAFAKGLLGDHTCALDLDTGRAFCWGHNDFGQLGTGSADTNPHTLPEAISTSGPVPTTWSTLSVGSSHTCGTSGTSTWCWGRNDDGRLGDSTTTTRFSSTLVRGGLTFDSVSAGMLHNCGLTRDGHAYCWGQNGNGQLGTGAEGVFKTVPVPVAGGLTFTSISAGGNHTCAISTDGNTYCWGVNQFGELGDGTNTNRSSPTLVSGGLGFESVSVGGLHTCARTKDLGIVYCWGNNGQGQLGNATTTNSNVPVRVVDQR